MQGPKVQAELENQIVTPDAPQDGSLNRERRVDAVLCIFLASCFVGLIMLWFAFDHRIPSQDEAYHVLSGFAFRDLLAHSRLWQYQWWYHCFTVSKFYPPFVYFVNGVFELLLGQSRFIEQLAAAFFSGLMLVSLYILIRLLNGGRIAACVGMLILSAYPLVTRLGHTYFLDLPAVAMMTCALAALLWSRRGSRPQLKRGLLAGLLIGAACLSKPSVISYLLPLALYFAVPDVLSALRKKQISDWLQLTILTGATAVIVCLPFYVVSIPVYREWLARNVLSYVNVGIHRTFFGNITAYLQSLPLVMSPALLGVFFDQLIDFVANSGKYDLKMRMELPDKSELLLYRRHD